MPIRAIAYHPAIAMNKMQTNFTTEPGGVSVGRGIQCPKCGLTFTVIFPVHNDLEKAAYRNRLKALIVNDCKRGKHKDEYVVDDMP